MPVQDALPLPGAVRCGYCDVAYVARTLTLGRARYCSARCRQWASRWCRGASVPRAPHPGSPLWSRTGRRSPVVPRPERVQLAADSVEVAGPSARRETIAALLAALDSALTGGAVTVSWTVSRVVRR